MTKSKLLQIRVTTEEHANLRRRADMAGMSVSQFVRGFLYLERRGGEAVLNPEDIGLERKDDGTLGLVEKPGEQRSFYRCPNGCSTSPRPVRCRVCNRQMKEQDGFDSSQGKGGGRAASS